MAGADRRGPGSRTSVWLWMDLGATSQGREQAVPMYLVPAVETGGCGSPTMQGELLGPRAFKEFLAWFLQAQGSRAWCRWIGARWLR